MTILTNKLQEVRYLTAEVISLLYDMVLVSGGVCMARGNLNGKKVAVIATDYFEESELKTPVRALKEAGAQVDIIAPKSGQIQGLKHIEPGDKIDVNKTLSEANPDDYDALVVPGGAINSDELRMDEKAKQFLKKIWAASKPVAIICHGPWLLASTGLAKGKHLTSFFTIQDDMRNAGADWTDEEVVVDGNLITSRQPGDLPAFNRAIISALSS